MWHRAYPGRLARRYQHAVWTPSLLTTLSRVSRKLENGWEIAANVKPVMVSR